MPSTTETRNMSFQVADFSVDPELAAHVRAAEIKLRTAVAACDTRQARVRNLGPVFPRRAGVNAFDRAIAAERAAKAGR